MNEQVQAGAGTGAGPGGHDVDVAIIGAGPAGLAAAVEASAVGARVALIDMNPRLGGQYWRHGAHDDAPDAPAPRAHHDWGTYRDLADGVRQGIRNRTIEHLPETHVWAVDRGDHGFALHLARTAEARGAGGRQRLGTRSARRLVIAAGTHDRHLPIPGWTLPGVVAAGGIQAFVKVQGVPPGRRVVLAGTGPFLLAAAHSVIQAGGEVVAILESSSLTRWLPGGALGALVPSKGVEGAQYAAALASHGVAYRPRRIITRIDGDRAVRGVRTARVSRDGTAIPGTETTYEDIDVVGLGWGFTPQIELITQLGATTRQDVDRSVVGVVDRDLATGVPGLFLAGEVTGVKGAAGAVADGRIAGRAAAGAPVRRRDRLVRARHAAFARAMHRAHPVPPAWESWLGEDTTICRCEEVPYAVVRAAREDVGAVDPRTLKGETRVGMGYCQGRMCGLAALCLSRPGSPEAARSIAARPVALPIELGALAETAPERFPEDASDDASGPSRMW